MSENDNVRSGGIRRSPGRPLKARMRLDGEHDLYPVGYRACSGLISCSSGNSGA